MSAYVLRQHVERLRKENLQLIDALKRTTECLKMAGATIEALSGTWFERRRALKSLKAQEQPEKAQAPP